MVAAVVMVVAAAAVAAAWVDFSQEVCRSSKVRVAVHGSHRVPECHQVAAAASSHQSLVVAAAASSHQSLVLGGRNQP